MAEITKKKSNYLPDEGLQAAVEMAIEMEMPLFITGEPGTGKTMLAYWIAQNENYRTKYKLHNELLRFNVKTTTTAKDLLYRYDAIRHFRDSRRADEELNILNYIHFEALGQAILTARTKRHIVLVDEIDKAPRDLPNDLLYEFEKLSFRIEEASKKELEDPQFSWKDIPSLQGLEVEKPVFDKQHFIHFASKEEQGKGKDDIKKPILILTSNSEKNLPDAFLRRCAFYHIPFPENKERLLDILEIKGLYDKKKETALVQEAVDFFLGLRQNAGLRKKPATAELIAWVELLHSVNINPRKELSADEFRRLRPSLSLLGKNKEDLDRIESQLKKKANS